MSIRTKLYYFKEEKPVKKSIAIIAAFLILLSMPAFASCPTPVNLNGLSNILGCNTPNSNISINLNGCKLNLNQAPVLDNNCTLVPLRGVLEQMGAKVNWNPNTCTATVQKDGKTVELKPGCNIAKVNGCNVKLDAPCKLTNGCTMVPLRFVSQCLGAKVGWDNANKCVSINCGNTNTVPPSNVPKPTAAPAPTAAPNANATAQAQRMLSLINAERSKAGAGALSLDAQVSKVAQLKAQDMVDKGYFDHNSPTYGSPFDMMKKFGVSFRTAGENLAGNQNVDSAHNALMNSPGHRANILNTSFNKIGLGIVNSPVYGKIFVQMFIG